MLSPYLFISWPRSTAHGIFVSQPEMKPKAPACEVLSTGLSGKYDPENQ